MRLVPLEEEVRMQTRTEGQAREDRKTLFSPSQAGRPRRKQAPISDLQEAQVVKNPPAVQGMREKRV